VADDDYGKMTREQAGQVALALSKLTPEQLVKVVMAIEATLLKSYHLHLVQSGTGEWSLS
jgi:hypothetical protein